MSMHDKTLFFFDKVALAAAANTTVNSKLIDNRLNGDDIDGRLFVNARLGAAAAANSVKFTLLTSDDGNTWTTLLESGNTADGTLCQARLPLGTKRYLKATAKVATALSAATTVFAEITDTLEHEGPVKVQEWKEDVAAEGDAVRKSVEG